MKKAFIIIGIIVFVLVAENVQAQTTLKLSYAPETFSYSNRSDNYQGFSVGFITNFNFTKNFGVMSGAQFRMNFRNKETTFVGVQGILKEKQFLIDMPVLLSYGIDIKDCRITPFVGPMFSIALSGNSIRDTPSELINSNTNWYDENGKYNRFNVSIVIGGNVKYSHLSLYGGYRIGLLDLLKDEYKRMTTSGLFLGIGYTF